MKTLRIPLAITLVILASQTFQANAQTETVLHDFGSFPADGNSPIAGLVEGGESDFYGTTTYGGTNIVGIVFRISSSGSYKVLYTFGSSPDYNDGASPEAGLVQGGDGNFYGTTLNGGTSGGGTVFKISPSGTLTTLHSFSNDSPEAGLVQGSDGNFYGTTLNGGTSTNCGGAGCGTVFRISPSGSETNLHSFSGNPDGASPEAGLVQGSDSNFYGTTLNGGTSTNCGGGCGTVFRITPGGAYTILYSFAGHPTDGAHPYAGLVQGSDGNFYGTTFDGGTSANCDSGCGTVFRVSPSGSYTILYSFGSYPTDGLGPGGLVQGSDGNIYGTTVDGGANSGGTFFRISPSGSYTNLYSFPFAGYPNDGEGPVGVVQGSDGNFYGTTGGGGTSTNCGTLGCGTVFKLNVGLGPIGNNCTFSIGSADAVFDAAGGSNTVSVSVSDGCDWTASSDNGFITITSGSSGTGNGTVGYTVAPNTSSTSLTGTMTIAGQTFTVTQSGAPPGICTYSLSAASVTLTAKGGSKNVSVKVKGSNCSWTAASNDPFITITSGSSGTGNGKVVYTVLGNTNSTERSGTITIAGQSFTVTQLPGGCKLTLSPKTAKLKAAGASVTVKVKANLSDCTWAAVSNDPFITITAGASGVGNGTVSYTVAANTNTTALTGSIAIGGETFTVTESGAK